MSATIPELRDAIIDEINDATWSETLTAERVFAPKRDVKSMGDDAVALVVPYSVQFERLSRAMEQKRIVIHVAIQKRLASDDMDAADALINLSQSVLAFFRAKKLDDAPDMLWVSGDNPTVFSYEHYDEFLVFTAIIAITYLQTQG